MKLHWTRSEKRWKDSGSVGFALLACFQTIAEITGLFDVDLIQNMTWWSKLLAIFALFIFMVLCCFIFKQYKARKGITLNIGDNVIQFKQADIFKQNGWRLIPFNEMFDTQVDDIVIAHKSLNGIFIDSYVENIEDLQKCINSTSDVKGLASNLVKKGRKFPLGRIIPYNDSYLLLAFTHFEDNKAYLSHSDFEKCLITMWKEIERVYAFKEVYIPLLGSGITRFTDTPHKDQISLARCLLCTLKMSGVHIKQPITVCLTPEIMEDINIYEIKNK